MFYHLLISSNCLLTVLIVLIDLYFIFGILLLCLIGHLILLAFFRIMPVIAIFFMGLYTIYLKELYLVSFEHLFPLLLSPQIGKNPFYMTKLNY
jgi:hypothetical protein